MSDGLIGVIVGGLLTGAGTWFAMWLQHKKWKTEQHIRLLENKRDRLESLSKETLDSLGEGMVNNSYNSVMMSNIEIMFPDHVTAKFHEFMKKKDKTALDVKHGFFNIAVEVKKAISDIDKEIEALLK